MAEPKKNVIIWDAEIKRNPETLVPGDPKAGWKRFDLMGLQLAATYHTRDRRYRFWTEKMLPQLAKALSDCDLRVSFNGARFDDLLMLGLGFPLPLEPHYDIQEQLRMKLGVDYKDAHSQTTGLKLTQITYSTMGKDKSRHSGAAPVVKTWPQISKLESPESVIEAAAEVCEGCLEDVCDTADLFTLIAKGEPLISPVHGKVVLPDPRGWFAP